MIPLEEQLQSRAELYLCLARAFLTPASEDAWLALRDALADDLDEIDGALGYDFAAHVARYRAALTTITGQPELLQIYSGLFLAPPRPACINTGAYLDGAVNGGSVLAMEEAYRESGLARDESFRDLSDHLAIQLEFVASRYMACLADPDRPDEEVAGRFLDRFLRPCLPALIADLAAAPVAQNPWLHLARLLQVAVVHDARAAPPPRKEEMRLHTALAKARHDCVQNGVSADDMAFIAQRLQEKGLATDHLAIAPELRDEAKGWSRKVPPSPRRGSRLG
jgi:TorA maturation chaperone TorD